jgi:hypothetical protein
MVTAYEHHRTAIAGRTEHGSTGREQVDAKSAERFSVAVLDAAALFAYLAYRCLEQGHHGI